jgi:hypothetical protein
MHAPEPLEKVLARAGEDRFAPAGNRAPIPPHVWVAAVGARIAERTRPVAMEGGVLVVRAATSVWANELSLLSEPLLARLRMVGVRARSLRFRVGPVEAVERGAELRTAKVPAPTTLDGQLAKLLEAVEDEELRAAMTAAARANLAWQEFNAGPAGPTEAPRAARAPQDAGTESAPRGRKS